MIETGIGNIHDSPNDGGKPLDGASLSEPPSQRTTGIQFDRTHRVLFGMQPGVRVPPYAPDVEPIASPFVPQASIVGSEGNDAHEADDGDSSPAPIDPVGEVESPTRPMHVVGRTPEVLSNAAVAAAHPPAAEAEDPAQTADDETVDVRGTLREKGVPESVLGLLNEGGVVVDYADKMTQATAKASDRSASVAELREAVGGVPYYSDHLEIAIREHFAAEGLAEDALDDKVNEVVDILTEVPAAKALDDAVDGFVRVGESSDNPMDIMGALKSGAEAVNKIYTPEAQDSAAETQAASGGYSTEQATRDAQEGSHKRQPPTVLNERTRSGEYFAGPVPEEVSRLVARHELAREILEERGAPEDPEAYRRAFGKVHEQLAGEVPEIDPVRTGDTSMTEVFRPEALPIQPETRDDNNDQ
jgi:hypothetical protein